MTSPASAQGPFPGVLQGTFQGRFHVGAYQPIAPAEEEPPRKTSCLEKIVESPYPKLIGGAAVSTALTVVTVVAAVQDGTSELYVIPAAIATASFWAAVLGRFAKDCVQGTRAYLDSRRAGQDTQNDTNRGVELVILQPHEQNPLHQTDPVAQGSSSSSPAQQRALPSPRAQRGNSMPAATDRERDLTIEKLGKKLEKTTISSKGAAGESGEGVPLQMILGASNKFDGSRSGMRSRSDPQRLSMEVNARNNRKYSLNPTSSYAPTGSNPASPSVSTPGPAAGSATSSATGSAVKPAAGSASRPTSGSSASTAIGFPGKPLASVASSPSQPFAKPRYSLNLQKIPLQRQADDLAAQLQRKNADCNDLSLKIDQVEQGLFPFQESVFLLRGQVLQIKSNFLKEASLEELLSFIVISFPKVSHLVFLNLPVSSISGDAIRALSNLQRLCSITFKDCANLTEETIFNCIDNLALGYYRFFNCPKISGSYLKSLSESTMIASDSYSNESDKKNAFLEYLEQFLANDEITRAINLSARMPKDHTTVLSLLTETPPLEGVRPGHLEGILRMFENSPFLNALTIVNSPALTDKELLLLPTFKAPNLTTISFKHCDQLSAKALRFVGNLDRLPKLQAIEFEDCPGVIPKDAEEVCKKKAKTQRPDLIFKD